jgi:hypothetical protein
MPAYWTAKEERQYKHIVKSCMSRPIRRRAGGSCPIGPKSKRCKCIAAATVNRGRRRRRR